MGMTNFEVGKGNRVLAQISDAAAELLVEAHDMGHLGQPCSPHFVREAARELQAEGFGRIVMECQQHGLWDCPGWHACSAEVIHVFLINDAGAAWLADSGRSE